MLARASAGAAPWCDSQLLALHGPSDLQASQQAEAARVVLKKRTVTERVFVREEDLRRSSRWVAWACGCCLLVSS